MADITPAQIFPNMTADATGITIPYTDLAGLTQAEATPATGDGREVARILTNSIVSKINALAAADKPSRMTVTKASPSGIGTDAIRQSYSLSFDVSIDPTNLGLLAEPTA